MIVQVHIARMSTGKLNAWVVQDGIHGTQNLLSKRSVTKVDAAKREIKLFLWRRLNFLGDLEIVWKVTE